MKWYRFDVVEYLKQTKHLPDADDLALRRMMDHYMMTEKPLPGSVSAVARLIGLDEDIVEPVLKEFFDLSPDGYRRVDWDEYIGRRQWQSKMNKESAKLSPRRKWVA